MNGGDEVLYYDSQQRKTFPDLHTLWEQTAKLGIVEEIREASAIVNQEEVPKEFVRIARQYSWYAFWRRRGFNRNLYYYLFIILFFMIFIR